jgi:hypothetical protein
MYKYCAIKEMSGKKPANKYFKTTVIPTYNRIVMLQNDIDTDILYTNNREVYEYLTQLRKKNDDNNNINKIKPKT